MNTKLPLNAKLTDQFAIASIAATALLTAALYTRLPERVPTHFNIHGTVDDWSSRLVGAWLLPTTALGMWLFLRFGAAFLPAEWRKRMQASPMSLVAALVVLLLCLLQCVVLYLAIHGGDVAGGALGLVLGAFWVGVGLVMPRMRRNPWVGVRTPWTLTSDENWARTHRFAGYVFVASGLIAMLAAPLGLPSLGPIIIVLSAGLAAIHSFVLARRSPPTTPQ